MLKIYILDFSGVALEFLMILYITNNSFLWNKFIDMNKVKHFNSWIEMSLWTMIHDMWNHALPSTIGFINGSSAVLTSSQIIVSILITHGLCDKKMIYSLMCLLMILIITKILHLTDWQVLRDQTEACNWFIVCCDCDYLSNYSCKTWQRNTKTNNQLTSRHKVQ